jgi:hypothetical protein
MLIRSRINTNLLTSNKLSFSVSRIPIGIRLANVLGCSKFIFFRRRHHGVISYYHLVILHPAEMILRRRLIIRILPALPFFIFLF